MAMTKKLGKEIALKINTYEVAQLMRQRALEQMGSVHGAAWEEAAKKYAYWDDRVSLARRALVDMGIPMVGHHGE